MPGGVRHPSVTPARRPPHDLGFTPADLVDTERPQLWKAGYKKVGDYLVP